MFFLYFFIIVFFISLIIIFIDNKLIQKKESDRLFFYNRIEKINKIYIEAKKKKIKQISDEICFKKDDKPF